MEISRKIKRDILAHLDKKEMSIITGARQIGKTTLLKEIAKDLKSDNKNVLFLNLDIDSDKQYFKNQNHLLNKISLEIGNSGFVFIDEIQRLENAGLFLKGLYDRELDYKFIISGSGSLDLKAKINESLAGRKRLFEMMPVSFEEFVNYKTNEKYQSKLDLFFDLSPDLTEQFLNEYLNFGGFPRVVTEQSAKEKRLILDDIYRSYVEKDIVYLLNIDRPDVFQKLIKILSLQTGYPLNYSKIATQLNISIQTLKNYLWYAEKTFSIQLLNPYFTNKTKEIVKSPECFFIDLGLKNLSAGTFGSLQNEQEYGHIFENFVFLQLKALVKNKSWKLNYWRSKDKAEVDFVIDSIKDVIPVEVKYRKINKPEISRSFRSFIEKYQPSKAYIINRSFNHKMKLNNTDIYFIPFYNIEKSIGFGE
jgi:predicted AAA+ superfamily ATPase